MQTWNNILFKWNFHFTQRINIIILPRCAVIMFDPVCGTLSLYLTQDFILLLWRKVQRVTMKFKTKTKTKHLYNYQLLFNQYGLLSIFASTLYNYTIYLQTIANAKMKSLEKNSLRTCCIGFSVSQLFFHSFLKIAWQTSVCSGVDVLPNLSKLISNQS